MNKLLEISKKLLLRSNLYKLEGIVILVTLGCFALSGIALPQVKVYIAAHIAQTSTDTIIDKKTDDSDAADKDTLDSEKISKEKETAKDTSDSTDKNEDTESEENTTTADSKNDTADKTTKKNTNSGNSNSNPSDNSSASSSATSPSDAASTSDSSSSSASNNTSSGNTSSGSSSGSGSSAPAQTEKVWVPPVYQTVHHDAVYQTVKVVVCNYCGAEFNSAGEFQVHKDANGG